jgi:hypothetical protein
MASYIVESYEEGGDEVKTEDIFDEDGVLKTRLIMQIMDRITLNLICMSGAAPATDFDEGAICSLAPINNYYVESLSISRVEGARRVTVTAVNLGIT